MSDRLYSLRAAPELPIDVRNIGNIHQISGIVLQGEGQDILLMLPGSNMRFTGDMWLYKPTEAEWAAIIEASDDPQYYDQVGKVWLRKAQRVISGKVQQIIWARDGFECMYCHRKMGEVQLTVDHFVPLELGGWDNETNYISSCAKCNREKGNQNPREWCRIKKLDYDFLSEYLMSS